MAAESQLKAWGHVPRKHLRQAGTADRGREFDRHSSMEAALPVTRSPLFGKSSSRWRLLPDILELPPPEEGLLLAPLESRAPPEGLPLLRLSPAEAAQPSVQTPGLPATGVAGCRTISGGGVLQLQY